MGLGFQVWKFNLKMSLWEEKAMPPGCGPIFYHWLLRRLGKTHSTIYMIKKDELKILLCLSYMVFWFDRKFLNLFSGRCEKSVPYSLPSFLEPLSLFSWCTFWSHYYSVHFLKIERNPTVSLIRLIKFQIETNFRFVKFQTEHIPTTSINFSKQAKFN